MINRILYLGCKNLILLTFAPHKVLFHFHYLPKGIKSFLFFYISREDSSYTKATMFAKKKWTLTETFYLRQT